MGYPSGQFNYLTGQMRLRIGIGNTNNIILLGCSRYGESDIS